MIPDFSIKRGSRGPILEAELLDSRGEPVDLSTAETVSLRMTSANGKRVAVAAGVCAVVSASEGKISYTWADGDTNHTPGLYHVEFTATRAGVPERVPSRGFFVVEITPNLGG